MPQDYNWKEIEASQYMRFVEPGDSYVGKVIAVDLNEGETDYNGETCGYLTLIDANSESWTVTLSLRALKSQVATAVRSGSLVEGAMIEITYLESRVSQSGRGFTYKAFQVRVGDAPAVWPPNTQPAQPQPQQRPQPAQPQYAQQPYQQPQQYQPLPQQPVVEPF